MADAKLKIFIVDDHYLILQGLSSLLLDEPGFEISGVTNDSTQVLAMLDKCPTDILLTDISMPNMSGAELTASVVKKFPHIKVIALSMFNDPVIVNQMMEVGVSGYILKATSKAELIKALNTVANGRTYFSSLLPDEFEKNDALSRFTTREIEIFRLIVKEFNNKQIAQKLFISERTVETHRRNILRKADAVNIVGLVKYAYENKIV
ncbi:response regulator [Mucilaginibacter paludis]|uniref:Two component transcriptional regulator, LuxR family n=1 Tax=Mucilaginibacter paludis DSM 18603 TaxID=714943 RepID=H1YGB4_9SPHI|nr:response regulator transcription factor [Mucilaginibacter paludis]EHQ27378.1 two component transcriptional regulator, LuxR family [Mucilaginibacter paludis DSM 18603]